MNPVIVAIWLPSLPILGVCITAMALAAVKLAPHRKALWFVQIGFGALILRSVVAAYAQTIMIQSAATGRSAAALAAELVVFNVSGYALMLVGIIFLAMAAFADRAVAPESMT